MAIDRMFQNELAIGWLERISDADNITEAHAAADNAIAAMRALPEDQQENIARQEFLRFKKFIDERVSN